MTALDPYALTTHDGKRVDVLTHYALLAAEKILGYQLTITQGSYNAGGVSASAGTHDGGGVVDLSAFDWANKVRALRSVGFAAWHRTPEQGPWPAHIHAVLRGNEKLSPAASKQALAFDRGLDGLASNRPDPDTYHPGVTFTMPKAPRMRVVGFNMHQATTKRPVRRLIARLVARWGRRPDVICLQEARFAHDSLRTMNLYRFVGGGHPERNEGRAELVTLVHKRCAVVASSYMNAADADLSDGPNRPKAHPRGIQSVIVERDGHEFAVINTHMGFTTTQVAEHAALLADEIDRLQADYPTFVAGDMNEPAVDRVFRMLLKRKFVVNRNGVDLIASSLPMRGGRVAKRWTGSDHAAVTARTRRK